MHQRLGKKLRVFAFIFVVGVVLVLANAIAAPYWVDNQTSDKIASFYDEPKNSVETLFLGPSVTTDGFIPMELYAQEGIAAYNLGTSAQPLLASYYWAREVERLNPKTLRTVVLEVSSLNYPYEVERSRMATDGMRLPTKLEAVSAYANGFEEVVEYFVPLFSYHDRWKELGSEDLEKFSYPTHPYLRGYEPSEQRYLDKDEEEAPVAALASVLDESEPPAELQREQLDYFEKLVSFCEEKGLTLILVKTPQVGWGSALHNAVATLAESYDLAFLDYNFEPLLSEIDYDLALDSSDGTHLNSRGARKLTRSIAQRLVELNLVTDMRGKANFEHLEAQLVDYRAMSDDAEALENCDELIDYLVTALGSKEERTVYVALSQNASAALTARQRDDLAALGLYELSQVPPGQNAVCVIAPDGTSTLEESASGESLVLSDYVNWRGMLPSSGYFFLVSTENPRALSVSDDKRENEANDEAALEPSSVKPLGDGIGVVVYDEKREATVHAAWFPTDESLTRHADPKAAFEEAPDEIKSALLLRYQALWEAQDAARGASRS